jgi:hypothetical protein
MHIHAAQASALGNALAGAQDAETAMSLRRARELRDAATRLKAASFEMNSNIPANPETDLHTDPQTAAQTVSMIAAWSGSGQSSSAQSVPPTQDQPGASSQTQSTQQVQRTPPTSPVSYWA